MRVTFQPALSDDESTSDVRARYSLPISTLNPGQELANTWLIPRYDGNEYGGNVYDFPDVVEVIVTYWAGWRRYKTRSRLNVATYVNSSASVSSDSMLGSARTIRKNLGEIAAAVKAISGKLPS